MGDVEFAQLGDGLDAELVHHRLDLVAQQPGQLTLALAGGGAIDLPVEPGLTVLPFAVAGISAGAPDFAPALTLLD